LIIYIKSVNKKEISMDCIFCKIAANQIPSEKVYESDNILAFRDIHPIAPEHILIIPKKHIPNVEGLSHEDNIHISDLFMAAKLISQKLSLSNKGYRLIINNGPAAGQEVFHIHMHMIGGKDSLGPMLNR